MANTLEHPHDSPKIAARRTESNQNFLKEGIHGAIDGALPTFAIVSGDVEAGLLPTIVIILGLANLVGEGFSIAVSAFLGTRAENQRAEQLRQVEQRHIEQCPEGERKEVPRILAFQGFDGELLEAATDQISSN